MDQDAEAAGLAATGGLSSGTHHRVDAGEPCRNCGAPVAVRYCTACGQLGASFQRPVFGLVTSSITDMFALDGRLWRTLPGLIFRPGRITREYIDGRRARYVPPFRLFLLSSVLFYFIVFAVLERQPWMQEFRLDDSLMAGFMAGATVEINGARVTLASDEAADAVMQAVGDDDLGPAQREAVQAGLDELRTGEQMSRFLRPDGSIDREALSAAIAEQNAGALTPEQLAAAQASADRAVRIYENQGLVGQRLKEWAPRFTLLFLPIFAMLLALSYAWHRRKFVYDHLITALHFQTFVHILLGALVLASVAMPSLAAFSPLIALGVLFLYLGRTLSVAYDTGPIRAAMRASVLLVAALIVLSVLATFLVVVSVLLV